MASTLDILTDLLSCWCDNLGDTVDGSPAQCCLSPSPTYTNCCDGAAWVTVKGAYPSKTFPAPYGTPDKCRVDTWALQVEIGIARCAPQPCEATGPVCCEADAAAVQSQMSDFDAMRRTTCCLTVVPQDNIIVGQYQVVTEGGCSYSTLQLTIRVSG